MVTMDLPSCAFAVNLLDPSIPFKTSSCLLTISLSISYGDAPYQLVDTVITGLLTSGAN